MCLSIWKPQPPSVKYLWNWKREPFQPSTIKLPSRKDWTFSELCLLNHHDWGRCYSKFGTIAFRGYPRPEGTHGDSKFLWHMDRNRRQAYQRRKALLSQNWREFKQIFNHNKSCIPYGSCTQRLPSPLLVYHGPFSCMFCPFHVALDEGCQSFLPSLVSLICSSWSLPATTPRGSSWALNR